MLAVGATNPAHKVAGLNAAWSEADHFTLLMYDLCGRSDYEWSEGIVATLDLGIVGPAQSDDLYHFTGRVGSRPAAVPQEIQHMTPQERLNNILTEGQLRAFPPFGAVTPCVCFSESPPAHLSHLIGLGRFQPWGIVVSRYGVLDLGGGSVAYVPEAVHAQFREAGLEHWSVRTGTDSAWMHEREWRLPRTDGYVSIRSVRAILVGDPTWRPSLVEAAWVDGSTGEPLPGPNGNPFAQPIMDLPRLWRESEIWVWDAQRQSVNSYPPGALS
ncbi:hypothetical protein ACFV13_10400 [Streptomyces bauhiniae]|uniref:hypothetical protein n=1 Tax=Streptomyces bauhiniae TaxID=2340725 RepID=UPI0036ABD0D4